MIATSRGSKEGAMTMKSKRFIWFIAALIALFLTNSRIASAQDDRRYEKERYAKDDRNRLEGTWYLNGERDKPCEIVSNGGRLEARNEQGAASSLARDRDGSIQARDW